MMRKFFFFIFTCSAIVTSAQIKEDTLFQKAIVVNSELKLSANTINELGDYDGDGFPDLSVLTFGDQAEDTTEHLKIFNLADLTTLADIRPDPMIRGILDGGKFLGYIHFSGQGKQGFPSFYDPSDHVLTIIDRTGKILWERAAVQPIVLSTLVSQGLRSHGLVVSDRDERVVFLSGESLVTNPLSLDPGNSPGTPADIELILKFQSSPAKNLSYDVRGLPAKSSQDFNGDGITDIGILLEDGNGKKLLVLDGSNLELLVSIAVGPEDESLLENGQDLSFADINGDGVSEILFGNNKILMVNGSSQIISAQFKLLDILDFDRDGFADLLGVSSVDSSVQIWGFSFSTSSSSFQGVPSVRFSSFPNPTADFAIFAVETEDAGYHRISITDLRGTEVIRKELGYVPGGEHHFEISLVGIPAGLYVASLDAGVHQSSILIAVH